MWQHIWNWILDFMGVNNTYNSFSTHMYNFWSGFGGNISVLALLGAIIGIYRHNLKRLEKLNPMNIVKVPMNFVHKAEEKEKDKD
jgi:hypothetical protein